MPEPGQVHNRNTIFNQKLFIAFLAVLTKKVGNINHFSCLIPRELKNSGGILPWLIPKPFANLKSAFL